MSRIRGAKGSCASGSGRIAIPAVLVVFAGAACAACARVDDASTSSFQVDFTIGADAGDPELDAGADASPEERSLVEPNPDWHLLAHLERVRVRVLRPDGASAAAPGPAGPGPIGPRPGRPEYYGDAPGDWIDVFSGDRAIDLFDPNAHMVLRSTRVPSGTADAVRVMFDENVELQTPQEKPHVSCPWCGVSGVEVRLDRPIEVRAAQLELLTLHFARKHSLWHGPGGYVLEPVIRAETTVFPGLH